MARQLAVVDTSKNDRRLRRNDPQSTTTTSWDWHHLLERIRQQIAVAVANWLR